MAGTVGVSVREADRRQAYCRQSVNGEWRIGGHLRPKP